MKKVIRAILCLSFVLLLSGCGRSKDVVINGLNLGKVKYKGINIMGVTYDFYDNGYAAITAILHENAQLTEKVTYEKDKYTVAVVGDIEKNSVDATLYNSVFGSEYSGIKSPVNLQLPDSITYVATSSLAYSTAEVIELPSNATRFGSGIFKGCQNIEAIEWPAGTEYIGGTEMFYGCTNLKSMTFPDNCSIYNLNFCFSDCTSLESVVIPGTVVQIGDYTFRNCQELTTVILEEGIEKIMPVTFASCPKLTHLIIPESVTELSRQIFYNCPNICDLTLPDNLNDIPADLFLDEYWQATNAEGVTIRVREDMVAYVQSIYPAANVVAK